jgi:hypothetical protein
MKGVHLVSLSDKAFNIDELRAAVEHQAGIIRLDLSRAQIRWADCLKIATLLDQYPTCTGECCARVAFLARFSLFLTTLLARVKSSHWTCRTMR